MNSKHPGSMVLSGSLLFLALALNFICCELLPAQTQNEDRDLPSPTVRQQDEQAQETDSKSSLLSSTPALSTEGTSKGPTFGEPIAFKWKIGVKIRTGSGAFRNVKIAIPVPVNWPEQTVELDEENVPAEIGEIRYRDLNSNVRQIYMEIRSIGGRQLFEFDLTFLVKIRPVIAPSDTTVFQRLKKVPKEYREYLGVGPEITYRKGKVRTVTKEVVADIESPWKQTEALFDWVRDNIEFRDGENQNTPDTLKNRAGNAEDLVGLFVAMCRANKIPARMVWVDGHQYAEFCLADDEDKPHWFPCNVAGLREFGSYSDPRVIQQKGDCIKIPGQKVKLKFVPELVTGGGSKPKVLMVRELTPVK